MKFSLKKLGPGLIFAGAAIGVSHLVQATKAGASFGLGLFWAMALVTLFKYPTFFFGIKYTSITEKNILEGYQKQGKWVLPLYCVLTFATMFTIQTAVTIVTAGIAGSIFGIQLPIEVWAVIILLISVIILLFGKYSLLDTLIKTVVILLSITTIMAVGFALFNTEKTLQFQFSFPETTAQMVFLIAFMGWMPAPLDVSVWQSLWAEEKRKNNNNYNAKTANFDFNVGYLGTFIIGICFLLMGALIMYGSGETFENGGVAFANQFLNMYSNSLGNFARVFIGIAAFACMFSTTLTTLDASPRAITKALKLLKIEKYNFLKTYNFWIVLLALGTGYILFFQISEMALLVKIATIISFLTAPFYAILNHKLVFGNDLPEEQRPNSGLKYLSITSIVFLVGFGVWYVFN